MTLKRSLVPEKPTALNRRAALWLLIAGSVGLLSREAHAKRGRRGRHGHRGRYRYGDNYEHDRAWEAVGSGKAMPLSEIVLEVQKVVPGDIVEVEFDNKSNTPIYKLTILSKSGSYFDVVIDARSGKILNVKKR